MQHGLEEKHSWPLQVQKKGSENDSDLQNTVRVGRTQAADAQLLKARAKCEAG